MCGVNNITHGLQTEHDAYVRVWANPTTEDDDICGRLADYFNVLNYCTPQKISMNKQNVLHGA
jgi:hypothetical protein